MIKATLTAAADAGMSDDTYVVAQVIDPIAATVREVEIRLARLWKQFKALPGYDETAGDDEFVDFLNDNGFVIDSEPTFEFHMTR